MALETKSDDKPIYTYYDYLLTEPAAKETERSPVAYMY